METTKRAVGVRPGSWKPDSTVTSHRGRQLHPQADFFVTPPAEIGTVLSAGTEVRAGHTMMLLSTKIAISLCVIAAAVAGLFWCKHHPASNSEERAIRAIVVVVSMIALLAAAIYPFLRKWVTYVGQDGFAMYGTRNGREAVTGTIVKYESVSDVEIRQVSRGKGIDTGGEYKFFFYDAARHPLAKWRIKVTQIIGKERRPKHLFDFGLAAHEAWQRYNAKHKSPS